MRPILGAYPGDASVKAMRILAQAAADQVVRVLLAGTGKNRRLQGQLSGNKEIARDLDHRLRRSQNLRKALTVGPPRFRRYFRT
jgi:hypothetical protein